jgi:hypothetical protein
MAVWSRTCLSRHIPRSQVSPAGESRIPIRLGSRSAITSVSRHLVSTRTRRREQATASSGTMTTRIRVMSSTKSCTSCMQGRPASSSMAWRSMPRQAPSSTLTTSPPVDPRRLGRWHHRACDRRRSRSTLRDHPRRARRSSLGRLCDEPRVARDLRPLNELDSIALRHSLANAGSSIEPRQVQGTFPHGDRYREVVREEHDCCAFSRVQDGERGFRCPGSGPSGLTLYRVKC